MALPPSEPCVKLITTSPFPAVAVRDVGAEGIVDGANCTVKPFQFEEILPNPVAIEFL